MSALSREHRSPGWGLFIRKALAFTVITVLGLIQTCSSHPTDRTFCTLRHYYREYSLVGNKDQLPSEARKACTTSDATYRVLRALMETEQQAGPCHPEEMHDLNFSAQAQLSLYVRKS